MRILKWPLEVRSETQTLRLPEEARVVHVDTDSFGQVCLWTESARSEPVVERTFVVVPTGGEYVGWTHVGTAKDEQVQDVTTRKPIAFFWHVLELNTEAF